MRARAAGIALVGAAICVGCANVKVHKVDVYDRMQGTDDRVRGFRYYLNRPYVVVGQRLPVGTFYVPAALGRDRTSDDYVLVALVPDAHGAHPMFDLHGETIGPRTESVYLVPGLTTDAADHASSGGEQSTSFQLLPVIVNAAIAEFGNQEVSRATVFEKVKKQFSTVVWKDSEIGGDVQDVVNETAEALDPKPKPARRDEIADQITLAVAPSGTPQPWNYALARAIGLRIANAVIAKQQLPPKDAERFRRKLMNIAQQRKFQGNPSEKQVIQGAWKLITTKDATASKAVKILPSVKDLEQAFADSKPESAAATGTRIPAPQATGARLAFMETPKKGDPKNNQANAQFNTKDPAAIQVVFLPDFEEQYAIRNKNCLAKTQYKYVFRNGTALAGMSGSYNATDVPVAIVETVGALISAAGEVAKTAISPTGAGASGARQLAPPEQTLEQFYVKIEYFIEPGVYRLQKSWEQAAGLEVGQMEPCECAGLFSEMGLDVVSVNSVLTPKDYEDEVKTGSPADSQSK